MKALVVVEVRVICEEAQEKHVQVVTKFCEDIGWDFCGRESRSEQQVALVALLDFSQPTTTPVDKRSLHVEPYLVSICGIKVTCI